MSALEFKEIWNRNLKAEEFKSEAFRLSAIDRNQCPQSIGTPVRNRRNPHLQTREQFHVARRTASFDHLDAQRSVGKGLLVPSLSQGLLGAIFIRKTIRFGAARD